MPFSDEALARLRADAADIVGRYPRARSALLPLLHLVQSEEGFVSDDGIKFCAEVLGCTETEVTGVATFYTMYKRRPAGEYQVGVCTNTLCAIMGGDQIYAELAGHLGADLDGHDDEHHDTASPGGRPSRMGDSRPPFPQAPQTPPEHGGTASPGGRPPQTPPEHGAIISADGKVGLERIECNAACDYAPVIMVNWEFFDNMTPDSARQLVDDLRAGSKVTPTRGPGRLCTWKEASRILAGFGDGQAADGPSAGPASLVGLKLAKEHGWKAPESSRGGSK